VKFWQQEHLLVEVLAELIASVRAAASESSIERMWKAMFCADLPPMPGSLDKLDIRFCMEGEYLVTLLSYCQKGILRLPVIAPILS